MSIYPDKLAHVQVVNNCRYSVAQMCTCEDMLSHSLFLIVLLLSTIHVNITIYVINNIDKPSLCTGLFTGDNQASVYTANGTRTVYRCCQNQHLSASVNMASQI